MYKPKILAFIVFLALGVSTAVASVPVPRKSPQFKIVQPSGKQTLLTSLKGRVVLLDFFLINCPRCERVAGTIDKLQKELGQRRFQALGIAFDTDINGTRVTDFVQRTGVSYPVGYSSSDKVDSYLGREPTERLRVPQIVVIDRSGIIRAQSVQNGEKNLEDENYLRNLIDGFLKERKTTGIKN
jgi:peroxiredoxin